MNNKFNKHTDSELIEILRNDKKSSGLAFKELYNRYSPNIHAYCFKIFKEEAMAEDIFQETFMRFYQNVKLNEGNLNVHGYLITIARNLSINQKKKDERIVYSDKLDLYESDYNLDDKKELLNLITMAMELLEFEYKEAFVLREYNGFTYEEIAEVTGATISNAKIRVFRARLKIKETLKPYLKDIEKHFK